MQRTKESDVSSSFMNLSNSSHTKEFKHGLSSLKESVLLLVLSVIILLNSIVIESPLIGFFASLGFLFIASKTVGKLFFPNEEKFFKVALGCVTFISLATLLGTFLILLAVYIEIISIVSVLSLCWVLFLISARKRDYSQARPRQNETKDGKDWNSYLLAGFYMIYVGVAFFALLIARTSEGTTSVWVTIPSFFLPIFFVSSLLLLIILFLTRINPVLKLIFLTVHSFLSHSLFLLVWYPGRYGDPWRQLGEARFIDRVGMPYAYEWLLEAKLIEEIVRYKVYDALVVLLKRMLSLDIYWVHIFVVPPIWGIFMPIFSYKIAELFSDKRTRALPFMAAAITVLLPTLIYWGAISVPNSLGFFLFPFLMLLLVYWGKSGERQLWLLSLLIVVVIFFTHPMVGIFAVMFFIWASVVQKDMKNVFKVAWFIAMFFIYPFLLTFRGATFSFDGLLAFQNLASLQSEILTVPLIFGFVGLLFCVRGNEVSGKVAKMLFLFYVVVISHFFITEYGMKNLPFGAHRVLAIADLVSIPFVALGFLAVAIFLKRGFSRVKINRTFSKSVTPRLLSVLAICMLLSSQIAFALFQAYPQSEIQKVQPAAYEIEAVHYIYEKYEETGRFVVLGEVGFVELALGLLGADFAYGANPKGTFGRPFWDWWTVKLYMEMAKNPSTGIMEAAKARLYPSANVSYFVVSVRKYDFDDVVERVSEVLPADKIFGDGKLYLFRYPLSPLTLVEGDGPPVTVVYDDGSAGSVPTRYRYFTESKVNYTVSLTNHLTYNITDYLKHWTFLELTINGSEARFDESSDINSFIYISGLERSQTLEVTWQANDLYPEAILKEDSFKTGWIKHPLYGGKDIIPINKTDGNIWSISGEFLPGRYPERYQYYYFVKRVDIDVTGDGQFIVAKWKSTDEVAAIAFTYSDDETQQIPIVPYSAESKEWTVTFSPELEPDKKIAYIMVGITNLYSSLSGLQTIDLDYILVVVKQ